MFDTPVARRKPLHPGAQEPTQAVENHSLDSERLVIAAAILAARTTENESNPREALRQNLLDRISHDDFFLEQHANIWKLLRLLIDAGRPGDPASIVDASASRQLYIGGAPYILELLNSPVHRAAGDRAINAAGDRIKSFSLLRQLSALLAAGREMCTSGASFETVSNNVAEDLQNLRRAANSAATGPVHVRDHTGAIIDALMNPDEAGSQNTVTPTGFPSLDSVIYGLANQDLILLAARPSMGKTSFALAIAEQCSPAKSVLIFSLEMTGTALARRMLARAGRVSMNTLRRNELGEDEWSRVSEGAEKLFRSEVWIDDTAGLTKSDIRSRARAFAKEHPNCLIIVDYLQFVTPTGDSTPQTHAAEVSKALKMLAREINAPVVALSQLNRSVEQRPNKRPVLSDLRDSGSLEQDADLIMFLYRDEYYNKDSQHVGMAEVIVAKQREGATATIMLGHEGKTMSWTDLGSTHYE